MFRARFIGLWRQPDFLKLWSATTITLLGSQVTFLALPLTAALMLDASPAEMGILTALEHAPWFLISLLAGVWIDRRRRRPILIGSEIGSALLLGSIPVAAALGVLRIEQLYVVAFLAGILSVFFFVSYSAFLPSLVRREQLAEANGKLATSSSLARIAGPGVAGVVVQFLTAPIAILADAISFATSALLLIWIRAPEPEPATSGERAGLRGDLVEGLRHVLGNPLIRAINLGNASFNIFCSLFGAVYVLYATRVLEIGPAGLGLIFSMGATGALLGAATAHCGADRFGLGRILVGTKLAGGAVGLLIPLASQLPVEPLAVMVLAEFFTRFAVAVHDINAFSLQQAITPERLMGRMVASGGFVLASVMPVGALIGGALGQSIGLLPTVIVGTCGALLAFLWEAFSPIRSLDEAPGQVVELSVAAD